MFVGVLALRTVAPFQRFCDIITQSLPPTFFTDCFIFGMTSGNLNNQPPYNTSTYENNDTNNYPIKRIHLPVILLFIPEFLRVFTSSVYHPLQPENHPDHKRHSNQKTEKLNIPWDFEPVCKPGRIRRYAFT